jgi:hypothetical protein
MSGGRAFVDITMSLDGFITGPNDSVESPLGEGGDRLHRQYLKAGLLDEMQIHVGRSSSATAAVCSRIWGPSRSSSRAPG